MNNKIQINITLSVDPNAPVVIVDGPNIYHDSICKKCRVRNCSSCKQEMIKLGGDCVIIRGKNVYANQKHGDWWERTLDIDRLPKVAKFIEDHGYTPVIYCQSSTRNWLSGYGLKKYPDDVGPKHKMLEYLYQEGVVVFDTHGGKPKGENKDEDDNWDDDIWIIHMALQYREQKGIDSFIMTNDKFRNWKKKRKDLNWGLIQEIQIAFEWQPNQVKEGQDQLFLAAKLTELKSLTAEEELEKINEKIERLQNRRSEIISSDIVRDELDKFALTPDSEIEAEKRLPHIEEIILAWEKSLKKGRTTIWDFWYYLRLELAYPVTYHPYPLTHKPGVDFTHPYSSEDKLVRTKLGFEDDVNPYRVVEECLIVYSNNTGKELKFSPDQTVITHVKGDEEE